MVLLSYWQIWGAGHWIDPEMKAREENPKLFEPDLTNTFPSLEDCSGPYQGWIISLIWQWHQKSRESTRYPFKRRLLDKHPSPHAWPFNKYVPPRIRQILRHPVGYETVPRKDVGWAMSKAMDQNWIKEELGIMGRVFSVNVLKMYWKAFHNPSKLGPQEICEGFGVLDINCWEP